MTYFGALKIGQFFCFYDSWYLYKKISDSLAVNTNGECVAFASNAPVLAIGNK